MFRNFFFGFCIIAMVSLPVTGLTYASSSLPTWETAFDPGKYLQGGYFINVLEEYQGSLYAVAGNLWSADFSAGQVFRSPDGKNWRPASDVGFGLGAVEDDCGSNYYDTSWDMIVFQERLYLLPFDWCYLRPGVILRSVGAPGEGLLTWEIAATTETLGLNGQFHKLAVFNDMLYVSLDYYDPLTEFTASGIFRSPSGAPGTWTQVMNFPGWGCPGTFQQFKGALYVASDGIYSLPDWNSEPEQIWRTFDGLSWEMVMGNGFGNPGTDGLGGFATYKGYLYVGATPADYGEAGGGQIWRTRDGKAWEPLLTDGFGNPDDWKVDGLFVYQGKLYAHTINTIQGCSVFRTQDAKIWESVNQPGWGNPSFWTSHHTADQAVFKDDLYMGVYGENGVILKMAHPDK